QTDIADGDHGLVCKSLQQADLLVAERTHLSAAKHDDADAFAFAQQWHAQRGANIGLACKFPRAWELFAFWPEKVVHMHWRPIDHREAGRPLAINGLSIPGHRNRAMLGLEHELVAIPQRGKRVVGLAQFARTIN